MIGIVILISGGGSNLQAIIDAVARGEIQGRINAVISNRPQAGGLKRAESAGIATHIIDHAACRDAAQFESALISCIDQYQPDLIALAGFMKILSADFVRHYETRMINIHPSLLPKFRGLNTHQRALESHAETHGATVHFVTTQLDDGPIIIQAEVSISVDDSVQSLAQRVLAEEHRIYPQAIAWIAEGRVSYQQPQPVQTSPAQSSANAGTT